MQRPFGTGESRAAEFFTIGWLLTTFTTLACELGAAAAIWFARRDPEALRITVLAEMLTFSAVVTGLFSLALLAAAWKLRKRKPPLGISVFALSVALAPWLMLLLRGWRS